MAVEQRAQFGATIEGIELTLRELANVFAKHGLQIISPAVGDVFDPQQHEAIFQQPTPGATETTVLDVVEVGYRLGSVELRPAKVVVAVPAD